MMCGTFGFPQRWIAVASVAIGMYSLSSAGAAEPEAAKPECLSLAVAVKDVCAWPNLTPLADGSVVATIFNQPCHGLWEGDVRTHASYFFTSGDDGRTWSPPERIAGFDGDGHVAAAAETVTRRRGRLA